MTIKMATQEIKKARKERQMTDAPQLAPMVSICTLLAEMFRSFSTASMILLESEELVSVVLMMKPLPADAEEEVWIEEI